MDNKKTPVVSIVMPTYNRVALLRKSVKSVLAQSFMDWELIIINDASTDDTKKYLDDLAKSDPRIRPIHNATNNYPDISKTLNSGLAIARGKYIARLDDDDSWADPEKLEKQVYFLDTHPEYMVVGGGVIVVDAEGKELFRYFKKEADEEIRRTALLANPFSHTTTMYRTAPALEVGGYGGWRYAEDWDLWLKLGERGKLYNFPEYFTYYLVAGQNKSFVHLRPQSRMIMQLIAGHRRTYPNFWLGYLLNAAQYLYSFLPLGLREGMHSFLVSIKRKVF